jgi:hypothetical protein
VSHDERSDTKKSSLHDTVPGVPEMELGRTLPTGAAFQQAASDSLPPTAAASAASTQTSSAPSNGSRPSMPPVGTGGPLTFGTTRRDFGGASAPKLSAREKAKRNVLTHTLQMPLVVTPVPPKAASAGEPRRMTIKGGAQPPAAPAGWTSMHRVGSGAPPEPTSSRPPPRSTVPLQNPQFEHEASERFLRAEPSEPFPRTDPSERFPRAAPASDANREPASRSPYDSPFAWQNPVPAAHDARQRRRVEYERDTLPGTTSSVRVPSLSPKEWLFIGLLAVASAATLYSLLIDDVTSSLESDTEAATSVAPEHVVTPAPLPDPNEAHEAAPAPRPSAAGNNVTEIVSEPTHAEIVLGGAVIGSTPAQVVRGDKDADYLLRKPGYEPQLVRVSPHSPKSITITLHAKQF